MCIDDIVNNYFRGKYLVLYKFEWVQDRYKKGDFKEVFWKIDNEIGKYNFLYPFSTHPNWPGIKWKKLNLDSMQIEKFEFKIFDVYLQDYEDYGKCADYEFTLEDFFQKRDGKSSNSFNVQSGDNLEIIEK